MFYVIVINNISSMSENIEIVSVEQIVNDYKNCWTGELICDYTKGVFTFGNKICYINDKQTYAITLISDLKSEESAKFGWFIFDRKIITKIYLVT